MLVGTRKLAYARNVSSSEFASATNNRNGRVVEDQSSAQITFSEIIGESPSMQTLLQSIETVAPTDASVLILGETGTGKELVARAIHRLSRRSQRNFVRINSS